MKQKTLISLLLCAALLLSMAACGGNDSGSADSASVAEPSQSETTTAPETESPEPSEEPAPVEPEPEASEVEAPPADDAETPAVATGSFTVENSKIIAGYSLEEIGTFADQSGLYVQRGILTRQASGGVEILAGDGTAFSGVYVGLEDLGDGYIAVTNSETDVNAVGLVTLDGEELIPCEAANIDWMSMEADAGHSRFLKVIYTTGETDNEDECFVYMTDSYFSFGPGEDDVMFTGYAKIYDTQEKQFVGDITITNPDRYASQACGNAVVLEDEEGVTYLYDAGGNLLKQTANYCEVGNGYLIVNDNGTYYVYDDQGNEAFSAARGLYTIDSTSGLLEQYTDDGYMVLDRQGTPVMGPFDIIYGETYGILRVETTDGDYALIDSSGNELFSCDDSIYPLEPGYHYTMGDTYSFIGPDGVIAEGLESSPYDGCVLDGSTALVIADKDFTLELEDDYYDELDFGLISVRSDTTGKYGVFDLITGTQLLDYAYAEIDAVHGYLYARQEDTWTVFKLNYEYR